MRKYLTIALLIGAALCAPAFMPVASADSDLGYATTDLAWRHESCRFQSANPRNWTRWEVRSTIACAVDRWAVPLETAMAIADRESGFYAKARNPSSGACGIYQHLPRYWPGRVSNHNFGAPKKYDVAPGCENARSNVLVSVRMMHTIGLGPWT